jgi:long-chain acyl-CoA synthetase
VTRAGLIAPGDSVQSAQCRTRSANAPRAAHAKSVTRDTLLDYFASVTALRGTYLVYDDGYRPRSYTYAQLGLAARNFAAKLRAAGVGSGDRVVLWSENRPAWVAAFWACQLLGAAVAPLDEHHAPEFCARVVGITAAKALVIGDEVALPPVENAPPVFRLSQLDWETRSNFTPAVVRAGDTCQILFTSGATAEPKGVVITHANILANVVPVEREVLKYRHYALPFSPVRFLNLLPLSHMFGQAMALFIPPMIRGTVVFQRSQDPREIVRQIRSRRISVLVSVPKILGVLGEYMAGVEPATAQPAPAGEKFPRRWWRYRAVHNRFGWKFWSFIVGGAALDPALEAYWGNLSFAVIQGYGLTETAPIVTLNHPFHARRGTVGKPIAGVQLRIAADGEVLVRGPNVTSGYYNAPEATAEAFADGWFHTGDIGELDETGRLTLKGRKKEMIVLADGLNVFPEDVERALLAQPGVADAAVVGLPAEGGERVHAVLALKDDDADAERIVTAANAGLADHQRVRGYTVWRERELPRTVGTNKLKRREIRNRITGGMGAATPAAASSSAGNVDALLARFSEGRELSAATTLDELGLSSLEKVELLVALERKLGTPVDETVFTQVRTVAGLATLQANQLAQPAAAAAPFRYPRWPRTALAHAFRVANQHLWLMHLAHLFAWVQPRGLEHLRGLRGPVLFASNHQSFFDTPSILLALPWRWRNRIVPVMRKEFFDAHFHPRAAGLASWFTNSLNYWLSLLMYNAVPLPQHDSGTRDALREIGRLTGDGWCPLVFPEGRHGTEDELQDFQPGIAMMAARLHIPVVPVRLRGSYDVLPRDARFAHPGRVTVTFGAPVTLEGDDYAALAAELRARIAGL